MHLHTLLAYAAVAAVAIVSPGPATLLALRNSVAWGPRTAVWSSLGNVCGLLLFPQFLDPRAALLPQFLVLTGLFMALSFASLFGYALLAARARSVLARPRLSLRIGRGVGAIFMAFGAALLTLRRQAG
jgi:threonine/homoserine/homoserine lactone efflux protein